MSDIEKLIKHNIVTKTMRRKIIAILFFIFLFIGYLVSFYINVIITIEDMNLNFIALIPTYLITFITGFLYGKLYIIYKGLKKE